MAVPRPGPAGQRHLWRRELREATVPACDLDRVVQQFDLGAAGIGRAVAAARTRAAVAGRSQPTADDLWEACRTESEDLGPYARRIQPRRRRDELVLPDGPRVQLAELIDQACNRTQVYERWGFGPSLGAGRGITALFSGESGTGKTMAAEIVAAELKLDLAQVQIAAVISKYIGETEKNLARVFDAAERSGAVLLFDEADALFGRRTEVKDSHDRYANIEVDFLLQRMEAHPGIAILATNRRDALDRAFLRRVRVSIDFPFPDAGSRRRIWTKVFPAETPLEDIDWDELSRLEIAGGNIRSIAVNAAFLAAADESAVGMRHLMAAARREYAKIDRLPERRELVAVGAAG